MTEFSVHVVSLVETQNGERKVINDKKTIYNDNPIHFEVMGGDVFDGKIEWREKSTLNSTNSSVSVIYGDDATDYATNTIEVAEEAATEAEEEVEQG